MWPGSGSLSNIDILRICSTPVRRTYCVVVTGGYKVGHMASTLKNFSSYEGTKTCIKIVQSRMWSMA